jgi:hypothetical protein
MTAAGPEQTSLRFFRHMRIQRYLQSSQNGYPRTWEPLPSDHQSRPFAEELASGFDLGFIIRCALCLSNAAKCLDGTLVEALGILDGDSRSVVGRGSAHTEQLQILLGCLAHAWSGRKVAFTRTDSPDSTHSSHVSSHRRARYFDCISESHWREPLRFLLCLHR